MKHRLNGHKPPVKAHRRSISAARGTLAATYTAAAAVDGNTSAIDLSFSAPVTPSSANPLNVLAIALTAAGGTSRHGVSIARTSGNTFRVTLDGALTASKTYAVAVVTGYASFVDTKGIEVTGTKNAATPA